MKPTTDLKQKLNELYENLSAELREQFEKCQQTITVPAGALLAVHGAALDHVIIIDRGSAEISVPVRGRSIPLAVVGPGKVLGLRSVISGEAAEINVIAAEKCTLTMLPKQGFLDVLNQYPQVYFPIARILSADLELANNLLRQAPRQTRRGSHRIPPDLSLRSSVSHELRQL